MDEERIAETMLYTIGGKKFLAPEPDLGLVAELVKMSPTAPPKTTEEAEEQFDLTIKQLWLILKPVQDDGETPARMTEKQFREHIVGDPAKGKPGALGPKSAGSIIEEVLGEGPVAVPS